MMKQDGEWVVVYQMAEEGKDQPVRIGWLVAWTQDDPDEEDDLIPMVWGPDWGLLKIRAIDWAILWLGPLSRLPHRFSELVVLL